MQIELLLFIQFNLRKLIISSKAVPNLVELPKTMNTNELVNRVKEVEGFSTKTASNVVANLQKANEFVSELNRVLPREHEDRKQTEVESKINNCKIVCTGFRDNEFERELMLRGATVSTSVSKNTDIVIVKDLNEKPTTKLTKAIQLGIKVVQKDEFVREYM